VRRYRTGNLCAGLVRRWPSAAGLGENSFFYRSSTHHLQFVQAPGVVMIETLAPAAGPVVSSADARSKLAPQLGHADKQRCSRSGDAGAGAFES